MQWRNWLDGLRNLTRTTRRKAVRGRKSRHHQRWISQQFNVSPLTERLEDRALLAAITGTLNGTSLDFVGDTAANALTISYNSGTNDYTFASSTDTITITAAGATITNNSSASVTFNIANASLTAITFAGDQGNDSLTVNSRNDAVSANGEQGNDTFTLGSGLGSFGGTIDGGLDTNTLVVTDGTNDFVLNGTPKAGSLSTTTFSQIDTIIGGSGSDTFYGTGNADAFTISGANAGSVAGIGFTNIETLDGKQGKNTFTLGAGVASFNGSIMGGGSVDSTLVVTNGANDFVITGANELTLNTTTTATGIAFVQGGSDSDTVTGQNADENFTVAGSKAFGTGTLAFTNIETLAGGGGTDTITGTSGNDAFAISAANAGSVASIGFSAISALDGAAGDDTFTLASGLASFGGSIIGGADNDTLAATNGTNTFTVTAANTGTLNSTTAFSNIDTLSGGSATDKLVSSSDNNATLSDTSTTLFGTALAISGFEQADLTGGASANTINAATFTGVVTLSGAAGADTLTGGSGADSIDGGTGTDADSLSGGAGNDTIIGGAGNDTLVDGAGNDSLVGGADDDTYVLTPGSADIVTDTSGSDTVSFTGAAAGITIDMDLGTAQTVDGSNTVQLVGQIENFTGSPQNDTVAVDTLAAGVTRNMVGGAGAGDVLTIDAKGQTVMDTGSSIVFGGGFGTISYSAFETVNLTNVATAPVNVAGNGGNNAVSVSISGGNLVINQDGVITNVPFASVSSLTIDGGNGDDTLTLDFGTNPIPTGGITFNGGAVGNDKLVLQNGSFTSAKYSFTNETDGSVDLDGKMITYTGLDPISSTINAATVQLDFSTTAETITVTDSGTAGMTTVDSNVGGESVTFANPSTSLIINAGDTGDDVVTFTGFGSGFAAGITVAGGTGSDTVNFNAAGFTYASLSLTAETINVNTAAITTTNGQTYVGNIALATSTVLTAGTTIGVTGNVNGAFNLTLAATGGSDVSGTIGSTIVDLTVNAGALVAGTIDITGNLDANVAVSTDTGAILVDGNIDTESTLISNTTINVGGTSDLGGDVTSTGDITLTGAVTLTSAVSLNSNGGNILLSSTLAGGSQDLTIAAGTAAGTTTFTGAVSGVGDGTGAAITIASTGLARFMSTVGGASGIVSSSSSGSTRFDVDVTLTDGTAASSFAGTTTLDGLSWSGYDGLTFTGAVTMSSGAVSLNSNGGNILLSSSLAGGGQDLTIASGTGAGTTTFTGTVSAVGDGTGAAITIDSTGLAWFKESVGKVGLLSGTASAIVSSGIVSSSSSGSTRFDADVELTDGDTASSFAGITTFDGMTYRGYDGLTFTGAVTMSSGELVLGSYGGNILFSSTLAGGGQKLKIGGVTGAGTVTFTGAVSNVGTGLGAAITLQGTGLAWFKSTVGGISGILSDKNSGSTRFDDDVTLTDGNTASSFAGTTQLDGLNWSGYDGLTFTGAVTMSSGAVSLNSNGGNILLSSTLAGGGQDLTIASGTGAGTTTFTGAVSGMGDGTGAAITIDSTGLARFMNTVGGASGIVSSSSSGSTRFDGDVTLTNGDTASSFNGTTQLDGLNWSGFGGLTFTGAVTMSGGAVSLNSNGSSILFSSTLAGGGQDLTIASGTGAGTTTFTDAVSGIGNGTGAAITIDSTGLARFMSTVGGASGIVSSNSSGSTQLDDDVTLTDGNTASSFAGTTQLDGLNWSGYDGLTFTGAVSLSSGAVSLNSNGGNILLSSTLSGAGQDLTIASGTGAGTTTFTGAVSGMGDATGAAITIASTGLARFMSTVGGASGIVSSAGGGSTRFDGDVTLTNGDTGSSFAGTTTLDGLSWSGFDGLTFTGAVTLSSGAVSLTSNGSAIQFGSTVDGGQALTLTAGAGNITATGAVGGTTALTSVLVNSAADATFSSTIRTTGNVTQSVGTGTTTFNGTSGAGIGGNLGITTNAIAFSTAGVTTTGTINLNAQNAIDVNASTGLNATASTITIAANQDGAGAQGFSQANGTTIQTTNAGAAAISITVGGTGGAGLAALQTGGAGRTTVTAGGAISDNNAAAANITGGSAALSGVGGIGSGDALETAITNLAFSNTTSGNVELVNTGALTINSVGALATSSSTGTGKIDVHANSPLTVSVAVSSGGDILLQAGNSGAAGDDLTISAGVSSTAGGLIELIAGDNVSQTTGTISTSGRVEITSDNEADSSGTISQSGGNIAAGDLVVRSYGTVGLTSATNSVTNLAAVVTNSGAAFSYTEATALDITTVDGVNGITTNDGDILVNATSGTITVSQAITTAGTGTTGGKIDLSGSVTLNATITAAGGDVTLNGSNADTSDLTINFALTSTDTMTLSAKRDVFIGAKVSTTGAGADINITGDSEINGLGGVRILAAGQVDAKDVASLSGSDLNATAGTVAVDVNADAGNAQVQAGGSVSITSNANLTTSSIIVDGLVTAGGAGTITVTANRDATFAATGDMTTAGGAISVTADNFAGTNGGVITQTNGSVFTAGGDSTITLLADGSITLGAIDSGAGLSKVTTVSGSILDADAGAGIDITAGTAVLRAETGVGSDADAIETTFGGAATTLTLAAETDSGDISISNTGSFTIGTVDALVGVTILDTVNNNSGADNITLVAASPLIVNSAIADNDGGNITLTASGATAADDLTLNATVTAAGGNGGIQLNAGSDIIQNAAGDVSAAGTGVLDYNAGTGTADGVITQADGATSVTVSGLITLDADGDIALANVQTGNATTSAVIITTTAGGVTDAGDTDVDVIAASGRLVIDAVTGIGSDSNGLETTVSSLDLDNATSGNIQINETNAVTVFDAQQATAGNISIVAGGTITVDAGGAAATVISTVGAGTISLDANGNNSDIDLSDRIQSASGTITLTADNDVTADANGDITSTSGKLTVTADVSSTNTSVINMADGALWDAGSGKIDLDTDGNITLGGLATTDTSTTAVTIDTTAGAVIDGGDSHVDIVANAAGARVVINAVTGIGSANAIDTTINELDADNSTSGNIQINETNAITVFDAQEATAGNISIVAGGTITVDAAAGAAIVTTVGAGTITLDANGATSDIVLNDGLQSVNGDITLTADNDITTDAEGDITSTSGNLSVTADTGATTGVITMADGALWDAGTGTITLSTDLSITLGGLLTTNATTTAVSITTSAGGVVDGGDAHVDIVANAVGARTTISAATGVGSAGTIETTIANLVLTNSTSGNVDLLETDAIIVRDITQNGAGTVTLNTTNGSITIEDGQNGVSSKAGDIVINANGAAADLVINTSIDSTSGKITVTADNDITFDAVSDITSASGNVVLTADADTAGGGVITMTDGSFVNSGTGTITASATGTITLSRFVTTNATNAAVSITSTAGGLRDADVNDATNGNDIVATNAAAQVTITTATGIGSVAAVGGAADHAIETDITILDASVTAAGDIDIDEASAINLLDVDTANGRITVDAGGAITATDVASTTDADANDIALSTSAGGIVVTSISAGTGTAADVILSAATSITESAANTTVKITADGLGLTTAGGSVGAEAGTVGTAQDANLLDTKVNTLEASITAGGIFVVNTQALVLQDTDLTVAGNDTVDRDNDGGTTSVTSTAGTVRINTTAGTLTITELVTATGQLASFNAVGILSDSDGATSNSDVNADRVAARSTAGIGTMADPLEINATSATNGLAFLNATAGDVFVRDVAGGLVIDDVDTLTSSNNTAAGVINVIALSPLTVSHDVVAVGAITLTATDSGAAGDNLLVTTPTKIQSTTSVLTLRGGDNVTFQDQTKLQAAGTITVEGDFGDADAGTGTTITFNGTVSSPALTTVLGGADPDFIRVFPTSPDVLDTDTTTKMKLDAAGSADQYFIHTGGLNGGAEAQDVTIDDSGSSGIDRATVYGSTAADGTKADPVVVHNNVTNGVAQTGGFVTYPIRSETVDYTTTLERLEVRGDEVTGGSALPPDTFDEVDYFDVQPSQTARILIHGNDPQFGDITRVPDGDVLDLDPFNNTFTIIGTTIFTDAGSPGPFLGVTFRNIESVPLDPIGTDTQKYDFDYFDNSTGFSPLYTGYTRVLESTFYGLNGNTFGFIPVDPVNPDNSTSLNDYLDPANASSFSDLVRDGIGSTESQTFKTDIANGWYLVSIKVTDTQDFSVVDADANFTILSGRDIAGHGELNFVTQVKDGSLDLTFNGTQGWRVDGMEIRPGLILTEGSPEGNPLTADGASIDNFIGYEGTPGALLTVSGGLDIDGDDIPDVALEITSTDVDPNLAGVQVLVGGDGQWNYSIRRTALAGTAYINFAEFDGAQTGATAIDYIAPATRRFDFGTGVGGLAAIQTPRNGFPTVVGVTEPGGFIEVTPSDTNINAKGYGWATAPKFSDDASPVSGSTAALLRDVHQGEGGTVGINTFSTQVENNRSYIITATVGQANVILSGMRIRAEGVDLFGSISTTTGQFLTLTNTTPIAVTDGVLDLQFESTSGEAWSIAGLEIREVSLIAGGVTILTHLGSATADGTTVDTITGQSAPNSILTVSSTLGTITSADISTLYGGTQIQASAAGVWSFTLRRPTVPGAPTITVTSADGSGSVSDGAVITYQLNGSTPSLYDFNGASSGVTQSGFTGVVTGDLYTSDLGYGWVGASPTAYSNAAGNSSIANVIRDAASSSSTVAQGSNATHTFRADLAPGTYDVTVIYGSDAITTGDTISVNGAAPSITGLSSAAGQHTQRTFTATTTTLGGRDSITVGFGSADATPWAINGIIFRKSSVVPVLSVTPQVTPLTADGTTIDTFSVSGLTPGQRYTISTTKGTVTTVDVEPLLAGVQFQAAAATATFDIQRPANAGTATISVDHVTGNGRGATTQAYQIATSRRFDFGTAASPLVGGYSAVTSETFFSTTAGFGWDTYSPNSYDRGAATGTGTPALYRDGAYVQDSTFKVAADDLTAYSVRVYFGDEFMPSQGIITVEGAAGPVTTSALTAQQFSSQIVTGGTDANHDGYISIRLQVAVPTQVFFVSGLDIAQSLIGLPTAAPLTASSIGSGGAAISSGDLTAIVSAAISRYEDLGLSGAALNHLKSVQFQVQNLGGATLGLGGTGIVLIDDDAAGHGWFVDATPGDDAEFSSGGAAEGKVDLLTAVMHELGHELGLDDIAGSSELMGDLIGTGIRRTADVDAVFAANNFWAE